MENIVVGTSEKRPLSPLSSFDYAAKGQKLSPRKVCVIWDFPEDYHIFILDLNSRELNSRANTDDGFISLPPSLLLERESDTMAFCVLDSVLYLFECRQKSVFTVDLSSSDYSAFTSNGRLDTSKLHRARNMDHTKSSPRTIPTPDGKILVFSSVITFVDDAAKGTDDEIVEEQVDFELYDPLANSWQRLPGLFLDSKEYYKQPSKHFLIWAFSFINKSTFFLEANAGMFSLDLKALDEGWVKWGSFFGAAYVPCNGGPFLVIEDEICLTPSCSYDIKTQKGQSWWYDHPTPSNDATTAFEANDITLLDGDNGEYNFCTLQSGQSQEMYPQLMITVYRCDLIKYRADKQKEGDSTPPSIDIVKAFRFRLDIEPNQCFIPLYLFAITAGTD